jgi:hypothetical protein
MNIPCRFSSLKKAFLQEDLRRKPGVFRIWPTAPALKTVFAQIVLGRDCERQKKAPVAVFQRQRVCVSGQLLRMWP